jgi:thiamine biosynthesis lipoprotein
MTTGPARASWEALGTTVELVLSNGDELLRARAIVERGLEEVDRACSRFREDSELTRVNARAGRTLEVGPLLIEAIGVALRAAELTGGDVDPTIGAALELAGYDRDWALLACLPPTMGGPRMEEQPDGKTSGAEARVRATVRPGWRAIVLDRDRGTMRVPVGVKLDLGATAKAWAADRACQAVHDTTGCGVLVSLGAALFGGYAGTWVDGDALSSLARRRRARRSRCWSSGNVDANNEAGARARRGGH